MYLSLILSAYLLTDLLNPYTNKTPLSIHSGYEPSLTAALVVDGVADMARGGLSTDWYTISISGYIPLTCTVQR